MTNETPTPGEGLSEENAAVIARVLSPLWADIFRRDPGQMETLLNAVRAESAPPRPSPAAGSGWTDLRDAVLARRRGLEFEALAMQYTPDYAERVAKFATVNVGYSALSAALSASPTPPGGIDLSPIKMILFCPACGVQHLDKPDTHDEAADKMLAGQAPWDNPPHRSHLCHGCGHIWRPADVPTEGVAAIATQGKADSPLRAPTRPVADAGHMFRLDDAPLDVDLWGVYGPDSFPTVFLCRVKDRPTCGRVVWGFSVWKRQPGFRTLGVGDIWATEKDLRFFTSQAAAFAHVSALFKVAPPHVAQTPGDKSGAQSKPSDPASQDLAEENRRLREDAERFRALMRCGRIKMQGSAGVAPHTNERNGNNVHFGAEFWPEPPDPEWIEHYAKSTEWGRACLRHLADAILEHEARQALEGGKGR